MKSPGTANIFRVAVKGIVAFGRNTLVSCSRLVRSIVRPTRFEIAVLLIAAGMIFYQDFVPPLIGMADSGDFGRLFPQSGLAHISTEYDEIYFRHFNSKYGIVPVTSHLGWYKSSSTLLIRAARWLSIKAGANRVFDIRILAALRAMILLFSLWLVLVAARSLSAIPRVILAGLLVLIFTDVGYVAYFNSLFSEATGLCFLALAVGASLLLITQRTSRLSFLIGYYMACAIVVTSKPMYVPLALPLALFGIHLSGYVRHPRRLALSVELTAVLCLLGAWYSVQTPALLRAQMAYIGIFVDLLPNSSTPAEDLTALGLNSDFTALAGTTPYQPDSPLNNPAFEAEFTARTSSLTLPVFYLTRPGRFYSLCSRVIKSAFSTRVRRLGYYEANSGKAPLAQSFGLWSSIRERVFPRSMLFLALILATGIGAAWIAIRTSSRIQRSLFALYVLFILIAAVQFLVVVLTGGGEADSEKHLFLFDLAFDVCLIGWVVGGVYFLKEPRGSWASLRALARRRPGRDTATAGGNVTPEGGALARFWRNVRPTWLELATLLAAAVIIVYQNFLPPLIGLADNGDFGRLFPQSGLTHISTEYQERYFLHVNSKYRVVPRTPELEWYRSSTSFLMRAGVWLSEACGESQLFDIRVLAAVYALLLLIGIWLILVAARSLSTGLRLILAFLLIIIFTDVGYVSYFNSFYAEGTALVFLAIGMGCALVLIVRRSSSAILAAGYFATTAMVVSSKPQYIPLAPAFALFGLYICRFVRFKWRYWLSGALAVALCLLAVRYYRQTPPIMSRVSVYVELFMDLLPNSTTPQQDLSEMGLNPAFASYSGTTPYQPDSPYNDAVFREEFSASVNSLTIPRFYLTHPRRLFELFARCSKHAFSTRVRHLGYYEASAGKLISAEPFGVWSSLRETVFPRTWFFLAFFFSSGVAVAVLLIRSHSTTLKGIYAVYLLFDLIAGAQFFIAVLIGGGEPDLEKHLFMFNLAFDVCLILVVLWVVNRVRWFRPALFKPE